MLNKEKYAKEIVEIATKGRSIAMNNETKILCPCGDFGGCKKCYFYTDNYPTKNNDDCNTNIKHWANSEYREPKEFTKQERAVIKALDKIEWVARDKDGDVYGYPDKPTKCSFGWSIGKNGFIKFASCTPCEFNSIKWEDTEPTSRAEILGG